MVEFDEGSDNIDIDSQTGHTYQCGMLDMYSLLT